MYALLPTIALGFAGAQVASAHWMGGMGQDVSPEEITTRQTSMFQKTATILGISVDQVKAGWAEGKSIREIAEANGITDDVLKAKMDAARKAKMTEHLNALVAGGVITQAQADTRLAAMEKIGENRGKKGGRHGHGGGMMGGDDEMLF